MKTIICVASIFTSIPAFAYKAKCIFRAKDVHPIDDLSKSMLGKGLNSFNSGTLVFCFAFKSEDGKITQEDWGDLKVGLILADKRLYSAFNEQIGADGIISNITGGMFAGSKHLGKLEVDVSRKRDIFLQIKSYRWLEAEDADIESKDITEKQCKKCK